MPDVTITRKVNGNHAVKVGEELRELLGVDVGDHVTLRVEAVHRRGDR